MRVAILISGRGSNMRSLIESANHYTVTEVIANRSDASGLSYAAERGIHCRAVPREHFSTLAEQKKAILDLVISSGVDYVALAGFMQILPTDFIQRFRHRIINIHPSLLPKYPGLDTHSRVLADQATEHGCSVHLVDEGIDTGPILAQAAVSCGGADTPDILAERVLKREHQLYPWTLNCLAQGEIFISDGKVHYTETCRSAAETNDFRLPNRELSTK